MFKNGFIFMVWVAVLGLAVPSMSQNAVNMINMEDGAMENFDESMEIVPTAQALAIIEPTQEGSDTYGEVDLIETKDGVYVSGEFLNVSQGKHGIHIHENGSCAEQGNAAGSHFNPHNAPHGFMPDHGIEKAHPGDLGNVVIDEYGDGDIFVFLPGVSLTSGPNNVAGKAIVLHEKEDDFSQPTGNAGGRIGCGVITIVNEENLDESSFE